MRPITPTNNITINGIQYLRAIAALMVVVHHAKLSVFGSGTWPAFGHTGVDIFFVISGFVMAHATQQMNTSPIFKSRMLTSYEFLRKRLIRIYPLYLLGLIWVSRRALIEGNISSDLIKDIFFIPHPNLEYPDMLAPTLIQGWTLNYEMFFYFIFGITLLLGKFQKIATLTTLFALALLGIIFQAQHVNGEFKNFSEIALHFYTNDILLEFGFGIIAQKVFVRYQQVEFSRALLLITATLGFAALALLANKEGFRSLLLGIPAFFIVISVTFLCMNTKWSFLSLLGDASYAIYLFHWASFGATKPLVTFLASSAGEPTTITLIILANLFVAVISGIAIHLLIEKPILKKMKYVGKIETIAKNLKQSQIPLL